MSVPRLIAVMGPTGVGKTDLAERLARTLDAQLVNADAFLVYRGFDIGTNKPEQHDQYDLIDIREPEADFGVGEWATLALASIREAFDRGKDAIVVGGTGFYIRALFEEYQDLQPAPDPELRAQLESTLAEQGLAAMIEELRRLDPDSAATVDPQNPMRVRRALERAMSPKQAIAIKLPPAEVFKFAIDRDPEDLDRDLTKRVTRMWDRGWPEEVADILSRGTTMRAPAMRAIGYQSLVHFVEGKRTREETEAEIALATRQYAKRQRTWLRSEPRLQMLPVSSLEERELDQLERTVLDILRLSKSGDK